MSQYFTSAYTIAVLNILARNNANTIYVTAFNFIYIPPFSSCLSVWKGANHLLNQALGFSDALEEACHNDVEVCLSLHQVIISQVVFRISDTFL
jgi:hypothetical protein